MRAHAHAPASTALLALALALLLAPSACSTDPTLEKAVDKLGAEGPNGPSAYHRAGQPCGTCHQIGGPAESSDFAVGGTVFAGPGALVGLEGVRVDLVDSAGTSPPAAPVTNCVGNFFVRRSDWNPSFPIAVRVVKDDVARTMNSRIGHAASCADCHKPQVTASDPLGSLPHLYLYDADPTTPPSDNCPVSPIAEAR